jgi:hypothetical protein
VAQPVGRRRHPRQSSGMAAAYKDQLIVVVTLTGIARVVNDRAQINQKQPSNLPKMNNIDFTNLY